MLLIDEIDKTDQEFEAMLLEVLSDFQITIPELGRIEATTPPIVVLTSNDSRELTEALKRRCLYLWLDYPALERGDGDRPPARARARRDAWRRRLVEVIRMVRALDLKKPPSIAESIDSARDPAADGRRRHRPRDLRRSRCAILVKHRTDIDLGRRARRVKLGEPVRPQS